MEVRRFLAVPFRMTTRRQSSFPAQNVGVLAFATRLAVGAIREQVISLRIDLAREQVDVWAPPRIERHRLPQVWRAPVRRWIDRRLLPERSKSLLRRGIAS